MALFKKSSKKEQDHKILIAYGDALGIFDVWQLGKVKKKFSLEKTIVVIKKNPTEKVIEEAEKNGLEVKISEKPKEYAEKLKDELQTSEKKVGVKKLEEVADRSIMQDPC